MGLFSRAQRQSSAAGGNFNYIAQTFATQYTILTNCDYGWDLSEDERLFALALVNTASSIRSGAINGEDIYSAVEDSTVGLLHLNDVSRRWGGYAESEYQRLFHLLLQIEALTFRGHTEVDDETILSEILDRKSEILATMKATLQQSIRSPLYDQLLPSVKQLIDDRLFQYLVSTYTRISDAEDREMDLLRKLREYET